MSDDGKALKPMPLYARCNLDGKTVDAVVEWLRQEARIYRDCLKFSLNEQEIREHNAWLLDRMAGSLSAHFVESKQRRKRASARVKPVPRGGEHG